MWNENWIKGEDYPAWGDTDVYKKTISGGYLFDGENPKEAYQRVAKTVARRIDTASLFLPFRFRHRYDPDSDQGIFSCARGLY